MPQPDTVIRKNTLTPLLTYAVYFRPVIATPLAAALAQTPDPPQDRPADVAPSLTTRMLGLVRKLIDYGRQRATSLAQQPQPAGEARIDLQIRFGILRFGQKSTARILAQIVHALRLAAILEDRLAGRPARRHTTASLCPCAVTALPRRPASRSAKTGQRDRARTPFHLPVDFLLLRICTELGIDYDDPLWKEMEALVNEHRDNRIASFQQTHKQQGSAPVTASAPGTDRDTGTRPVPPARPALHLVSVATSATGPP